jgi:hypothetical protein
MVNKLKTRDAIERAKVDARIFELKELKEALEKVIAENGRSSLISKDRINEIIQTINEKVEELKE